MAARSIEQMAGRVAVLLEQRLYIRGETLSDKLLRGGRALPRKVRAEAALLAEAARQAGNPRLLPQIDLGRVAQAHDICLRHLQRNNRAGRRSTALMGIVSSIVFSLLAVGILVLAVLWWRGYL